MSSIFFGILPGWTFFVLSKLISLVGFVLGRLIRRGKRSSAVALEAGEKGWTLSEYQELYTSAREYLTCPVEGISVSPGRSYLGQVREALASTECSHYVWSPRTSDRGWKSIFDSFAIAFLFNFYGVVPVAILSDFAYRPWRFGTIIVTAGKGLVVTFMRPAETGMFMPHKRMIGPLPMAVSLETLEKLHSRRSDREPECDVLFAGALYEPRTSFLEDLKARLEEAGIEMRMHGRGPGSFRPYSNEEYWELLGSAKIVVTTGHQQVGTKDLADVDQFVYRYAEVLSAGSVLLAPRVPGADAYLKADRDYLSFESAEDAARKVVDLLKDSETYESVRRAGLERGRAFSSLGLFWLLIDHALGRDSFPEVRG